MLKILWSHVRDIHVRVCGQFVKYSIPIYDEQKMLKGLKSIEIVKGSLVVTFHRDERELL